VLGDMTLVGLNDCGSGLLVGADYRAQVFWVELAGELRGAYQVAEQPRELPACRLRDRADRRCRKHRHRIRWGTHDIIQHTSWRGVPAVCLDDAWPATRPF